MSAPEQREARIAEIRSRNLREVPPRPGDVAWLISEAERSLRQETAYVELCAEREAKIAALEAEIARLAEIAWPRPLDADRMLALHRANTAPAVSSPEPASSVSAERAALIADLDEAVRQSRFAKRYRVKLLLTPQEVLTLRAALRGEA